jgi:hypothetical protein
LFPPRDNIARAGVDQRFARLAIEQPGGVVPNAAVFVDVIVAVGDGVARCVPAR